MSPATAETAHASDPLVQRIEGEQLGMRYLAASRALLREAQVHPDTGCRASHGAGLEAADPVPRGRMHYGTPSANTACR